MYTFQAREILYAIYPQDSTTGSFKTSKTPNKHGLSPDWWIKGGSSHATPTPRDAAYLAAYVRIAEQAGTRLYASGMPMEDDFIWLDRAVIGTLLTHQCVELHDEAFELTDKGRALVAAV